MREEKRKQSTITKAASHITDLNGLQPAGSVA